MSVGREAIGAALGQSHAKVAALEQANAQYRSRVSEVRVSVKKDAAVE